VSFKKPEAMHPPGFPPGFNGLATTPPLGWRSWNAYGNRVSQTLMMSAMDALAAPTWTVEGKNNVSLRDVGYTIAGVDEGWEGCGQGVNGTQHDVAGNPVVNSKFPDLKGLVDYGHKAGLQVGFYENGCACGERRELMQNYQGDVRALHDMGFDGVKLDGCGAQRNMTLYAELMQATGKNFLIENCHWGKCTSSDDSSCPTADWCTAQREPNPQHPGARAACRSVRRPVGPFNWFRTSGDINNSPFSWLANLQTTIAFQDPAAPLSRPGCWAYRAPSHPAQ
jgi:alpha-galactosidase